MAIEKYLSRGDFLKRLASMGLGITGGLNVLTHGASRAQCETGGMDALQRRIYYELKTFTDWLSQEGVRGYVGEVNWPNGKNRGFDDATQWNALGERWYQWADAAELWVTMHCVDEYQRWGGFWLTTYVSEGDGKTRAISKPMAQATVFERHPTTAHYKRGIQVGPGQRWKGGWSNKNPGVYDKDYWYTSEASMDYLRARGARIIRLPFKWERIQPGLGRALDPTELRRLMECVAAAGRAGLGVILSLQNSGGYFLEQNGVATEFKLGGASKLTADHFYNVWKRLSDEFGADPRVIAYDIMNEPYVHGGLPAGRYPSPEKAWEAYSQGAVNTIRSNGDTKLLMIPSHAHIHQWASKHPKRWIADQANNHRYTAHHYFDSYRRPGTGGGNYRFSYEDEVAYWQHNGY